MSMISDSDIIPQQASAVHAATARPTRPFYWSLRRELWEHRSVYIAPLAVAGIILFGYLIRLTHLPRMVEQARGLPWWKQYLEVALPFAIAGGAILVTGLIVAIFYCLGALNNERRDRSVLFWKSLPVSDLVTVLAKITVPLIVIPIVATAVAVATQLVMLGAAGAVLSMRGPGTSLLWAHWPEAQAVLMLLYLVAIGTLWYAPIYGWLLMVSAWARRMPFLWAVLTPVGISILEKIALDTNHFGSFLRFRLKGFLALGFAEPPHDIRTIDPLALLTPARFFGSPGLWLGLVVAGVFIAAAVWLRRDREPV
jgi:ABC-2 type transport system permease protein